MADYDTTAEKKKKAMKGKKKRKLRTPNEQVDEEEGPSSKAPRIDQTDGGQKPIEENPLENIEQEGSPQWMNLQLILSLQNKHLLSQQKVELAYDYVKLRVNKEANDASQETQIISISRLIVFLNKWVQSLLITSENKIEPHLGDGGSWLDCRYWEIFKFCLEEALKLHVSLSFNRKILRVTHCISKAALSQFNVASSVQEVKDLDDDKLKMYRTVLDCTSLIFKFHGGVSNENFDLWVLAVGGGLELVQKIVVGKLGGSKAAAFALDFSCLLLEPFIKFLRVPTRKSGFFNEFIDMLVEPLLCLLDALHRSIQGSNPGAISYFLKLVEEVLSQGLFHPSYVDGFLSLQILESYKKPDDGKPKDSKTAIRSYHRRLFEKLEKIVAGKTVALGGIGELLRLYVKCIRKQKGVLLSGGVSGQLTDDISGEITEMYKRSSDLSSVAPEKSQFSTLGAETRKSMFEFFVLIMEPLICEMDKAEMGSGAVLFDACCTLKSINAILLSFMQANVYIRAEDISEGACLNFLKVIYDRIASFSARIIQLVPSTFGGSMEPHKEELEIIAKELVLATRYLLEIEYEVFGNDLQSLWLMIFSYGPLGISLTDLSDQSLLISEVLHLGCYLVNLYSELRQVNASVLALCTAMRRLVLSVSTGELCHSKSMSCEPSLYYESWAKSLKMVLCSPEFRVSIRNAVKSIPEGQACGCVRELRTDIYASLEWMKDDCDLPCFEMKVEILGRGLSEMYTLILDSLTVTMGNSCLLGISVRGLLSVIRPSMSILVSVRPHGAFEFLSTTTGRTFDKESGDKNELLSAHCIILFFLRLYMSCRSLYRQAISLAPPDAAKEMSRVMHDSFVSSSGKGWLERTEEIDEGYFSWIVQPSASLLSIAETVSDIYLHGTVVDCSPLIYVLVAMALQRLIDVNRLIKSLEYLLKRNVNLISTKLADDTEMPIYRKESKRCKKHVLNLRQEAEGLTNFIIGYLSLVAKELLFLSTSEDVWDFGVGALNKKSLPTAIWYIICQNIDIWSSHAAKKKMKIFLSVLFQSSFPCSNGSVVPFRNDSTDKLENLKTVIARVISFELLSDTVLYEQRFVRRCMASRFCRYLEKSASTLFSKNGKVDLKSPPNWPDFLIGLGSSSILVSENGNTAQGSCSGVMPISHSFSKQLRKGCSQPESLLNTKNYTVCWNLLNFLGRMPKGYLSSGSFSLYATCILNLERLIVDSLLGCHGALQLHDGYELFRLFLSCRRALKHLIVAFCEGKIEASMCSLPPMFSDYSLAVLWLLNSISAVSDCQHAFSEVSATQVKDMMFSLMDYTSHLFLVLSKAQFFPAIHSLISAGKSWEQKVNAAVNHEQILAEAKPSLYCSEDFDAWNCVIHIAESLNQQAENLLVPITEAICSERMEFLTVVHASKKLLCTISCFHGFFRGLSAAYDNVDVGNSKQKRKLWRRKCEPIDKVNLCIETFGNIINSLVCELIFENGKSPQSVTDAQALSVAECNDNLLGVKRSTCMTSNDDKLLQKKRFQSEKADVGIIMTKVGAFKQQCQAMPFLQALLTGDNHEAAFFLRELFIAASAMLKLNLQINSTSLLSSLAPTFIGIAQVLFVDFANKIETPLPFSFVLLYGISKYLEELWNHFFSTNPMLPEKVYAKLIDLHLMAIGKCISLQGKEATLASREAVSSTKTLNVRRGSSYNINYKAICDFKGSLRMAFAVFQRVPSEVHILCAIQYLERVLVAEGCMTNYQICSNGGKVTSIIAACIDCLDLLLEFATERKCSSKEVKGQIQRFVACLFNVILRLQSPRIFYSDLIPGEPDPGSVILMCVDVLTRISRKPAGYQMDSCYVQQGLHIPATLFQNIFQLRISDAPAQSPRRYSDIESLNSCVVDRKFSVDLYDACCRLLGSLVGHYARDIRPCIAILEDSVRILLSCLEMVDVDSAAQECNPLWELQEAVKCASFLRRIYEEIRHQCLKKEVFLGRHCCQFLSNYIWIYSGYGPLKRGIRREIDEALRPGVYALVDSCSKDDLQYMHTLFGEGPCRTHLANLRHDYELNFKYQGKV